MRILLINAVCGTGSTGKICGDIARDYERQGHTVRIAHGRDGIVPEKYRKYAVRIGSDLGVKIHGVYTRLTDRHGFGSVAATRKFLAWAEEFNPDLLWLHNIHGYYINIDLLFRWIKSRPGMQVKWTLHDCWTFTGHCSYFEMANCDKWKTGCNHCPQLGAYPASVLLDGSAGNYARKRQLFTGVKNMTLIVPSYWLESRVKESFLKEYPVEVVYNTVDRNIFQPTPSDFREKHGLTDKVILLGVASTWEERKGLKDLVDLSGMLDSRYQVVLVGVNEKQARQLPENILSIPRTNNQQELAQLYTMADLLVNPSREEAFGMIILEAHCCGTRSLVYEDTACEEVAREYGGIVVPKGVDHLCEAICREFAGTAERV